MQPRWSTLAEFEPLRPAETKLKDGCRVGEWAAVTERRPRRRSSRNTVRGEFVRFLALGGDEQTPIHAKGLQLAGAVIEGDVDLEGAEVKVPLWLCHCRFDGSIVVRDARLRGLYLIGSGVRRILADRMRCEGGVFLRIGKSKDAPAERFEAAEQLLFQGAHVSGNFDLSGAVFLRPAGEALKARGIKVDGHFIWRDVNASQQSVNLGAAKLGVLSDDWRSWERAGDLVLNGLQLGSIADDADMRWRRRAAWLKKQNPFARQPWEATMAVLRASGHSWEAECLAIELQNEVRKRVYTRKRGFGGRLLRGAHLLWGAVTGYGYRPMRTLWALLSLWGLSSLFFYFAASAGAFAPTNSRVYLDQQFAMCRTAMGGEPQWVNCTVLPPEYSGFNPVFYALDLILPVIDLHLEAEWAPMSSTWLGAAARAVTWIDILLGWAGSLALVAALTKLLHRD